MWNFVKKVAGKSGNNRNENATLPSSPTSSSSLTHHTSTSTGTAAAAAAVTSFAPPTRRFPPPHEPHHTAVSPSSSLPAHASSSSRSSIPLAKSTGEQGCASAGAPSPLPEGLNRTSVSQGGEGERERASAPWGQADTSSMLQVADPFYQPYKEYVQRFLASSPPSLFASATEEDVHSTESMMVGRREEGERDAIPLAGDVFESAVIRGAPTCWEGPYYLQYHNVPVPATLNAIQEAEANTEISRLCHARTGKTEDMIHSVGTTVDLIQEAVTKDGVRTDKQVEQDDDNDSEGDHQLQEEEVLRYDFQSEKNITCVVSHPQHPLGVGTTSGEILVYTTTTSSSSSSHRCKENTTTLGTDHRKKDPNAPTKNKNDHPSPHPEDNGKPVAATTSFVLTHRFCDLHRFPIVDMCFVTVPILKSDMGKTPRDVGHEKEGMCHEDDDDEMDDEDDADLLRHIEQQEQPQQEEEEEEEDVEGILEEERSHGLGDVTFLAAADASGVVSVQHTRRIMQRWSYAFPPWNHNHAGSGSTTSTTTARSTNITSAHGQAKHPLPPSSLSSATASYSYYNGAGGMEASALAWVPPPLRTSFPTANASGGASGGGGVGVGAPCGGHIGATSLSTSFTASSVPTTGVQKPLSSSVSVTGVIGPTAGAPANTIAVLPPPPLLPGPSFTPQSMSSVNSLALHPLYDGTGKYPLVCARGPQVIALMADTTSTWAATPPLPSPPPAPSSSSSTATAATHYRSDSSSSLPAAATGSSRPPTSSKTSSLLQRYYSGGGGMTLLHELPKGRGPVWQVRWRPIPVDVLYRHASSPSRRRSRGRDVNTGEEVSAKAEEREAAIAHEACLAWLTSEEAVIFHYTTRKVLYVVPYPGWQPHSPVPQALTYFTLSSEVVRKHQIRYHPPYSADGSLTANEHNNAGGAQSTASGQETNTRLNGTPLESARAAAGCSQFRPLFFPAIFSLQWENTSCLLLNWGSWVQSVRVATAQTLASATTTTTTTTTAVAAAAAVGGGGSRQPSYPSPASASALRRSPSPCTSPMAAVRTVSTNTSALPPLLYSGGSTTTTTTAAAAIATSVMITGREDGSRSPTTRRSPSATASAGTTSTATTTTTRVMSTTGSAMATLLSALGAGGSRLPLPIVTADPPLPWRRSFTRAFSPLSPSHKNAAQNAKGNTTATKKRPGEVRSTRLQGEEVEEEKEEERGGDGDPLEEREEMILAVSPYGPWRFLVVSAVPQRRGRPCCVCPPSCVHEKEHHKDPTPAGGDPTEGITPKTFQVPVGYSGKSAMRKDTSSSVPLTTTDTSAVATASRTGVMSSIITTVPDLRQGVAGAPIVEAAEWIRLSIVDRATLTPLYQSQLPTCAALPFQFHFSCCLVGDTTTPTPTPTTTTSTTVMADSTPRAGDGVSPRGEGDENEGLSPRESFPISPSSVWLSPFSSAPSPERVLETYFPSDGTRYVLHVMNTVLHLTPPRQVEKIRFLLDYKPSAAAAVEKSPHTRPRQRDHEKAEEEGEKGNPEPCHHPFYYADEAFWMAWRHREQFQSNAELHVIALEALDKMIELATLAKKKRGTERGSTNTSTRVVEEEAPAETSSSSSSSLSGGDPVCPSCTASLLWSLVTERVALWLRYSPTWVRTRCARRQQRGRGRGRQYGVSARRNHHKDSSTDDGAEAPLPYVPEYPVGSLPHCLGRWIMGFDSAGETYRLATLLPDTAWFQQRASRQREADRQERRALLRALRQSEREAAGNRDQPHSLLGQQLLSRWLSWSLKASPSSGRSARVQDERKGEEGGSAAAAAARGKSCPLQRMDSPEGEEGVNGRGWLPSSFLPPAGEACVIHHQPYSPSANTNVPAAYRRFFMRHLVSVTLPNALPPSVMLCRESEQQAGASSSASSASPGSSSSAAVPLSLSSSSLSSCHTNEKGKGKGNTKKNQNTSTKSRCHPGQHETTVVGEDQTLVESNRLGVHTTTTTNNNNNNDDDDERDNDHGKNRKLPGEERRELVFGAETVEEAEEDGVPQRYYQFVLQRCLTQRPLEFRAALQKYVGFVDLEALLNVAAETISAPRASPGWTAATTTASCSTAASLTPPRTSEMEWTSYRRDLLDAFSHLLLLLDREEDAFRVMLFNQRSRLLFPFLLSQPPLPVVQQYVRHIRVNNPLELTLQWLVTSTAVGPRAAHRMEMEAEAVVKALEVSDPRLLWHYIQALPLYQREETGIRLVEKQPLFFVRLCLMHATTPADVMPFLQRYADTLDPYLEAVYLLCSTRHRLNERTAGLTEVCAWLLARLGREREGLRLLLDELRCVQLALAYIHRLPTVVAAPSHQPHVKSPGVGRSDVAGSPSMPSAPSGVADGRVGDDERNAEAEMEPRRSALFRLLVDRCVEDHHEHHHPSSSPGAEPGKEAETAAAPPSTPPCGFVLHLCKEGEEACAAVAARYGCTADEVERATRRYQAYFAARIQVASPPAASTSAEIRAAAMTGFDVPPVRRPTPSPPSSPVEASRRLVHPASPPLATGDGEFPVTFYVIPCTFLTALLVGLSLSHSSSTVKKTNPQPMNGCDPNQEERNGSMGESPGDSPLPLGAGEGYASWQDASHCPAPSSFPPPPPPPPAALHSFPGQATMTMTMTHTVDDIQYLFSRLPHFLSIRHIGRQLAAIATHWASVEQLHAASSEVLRDGVRQSYSALQRQCTQAVRVDPTSTTCPACLLPICVEQREVVLFSCGHVFHHRCARRGSVDDLCRRHRERHKAIRQWWGVPNIPFSALAPVEGGYPLHFSGAVKISQKSICDGGAGRMGENGNENEDDEGGEPASAAYPQTELYCSACDKRKYYIL